jgi:hypothetical protein
LARPRNLEKKKASASNRFFHTFLRRGLHSFAR